MRAALANWRGCQSVELTKRRRHLNWLCFPTTWENGAGFRMAYSTILASVYTPNPVTTLPMAQRNLSTGAFFTVRAAKGTESAIPGIGEGASVHSTAPPPPPH
jgi:hypothetical protein